MGYTQHLMNTDACKSGSTKRNLAEQEYTDFIAFITSNSHIHRKNAQDKLLCGLYSLSAVYRAVLGLRILTRFHVNFGNSKGWSFYNSKFFLSSFQAGKYQDGTKRYCFTLILNEDEPKSKTIGFMSDVTDNRRNIEEWRDYVTKIMGFIMEEIHMVGIEPDETVTIENMRKELNAFRQLKMLKRSGY